MPEPHLRARIRRTRGPAARRAFAPLPLLNAGALIDEYLRATSLTDKAETGRINAALRLPQRQGKGGDRVVIGHAARHGDAIAIPPRPEGAVHVLRPPGTDGSEYSGWIAPLDRTALPAWK